MTDNLDQKLSKAQEELDHVASLMNILRQNFIDSTAKFLQSWYENEAQAHVIKNAQVTRSLSDEKLEQMKAEVTALQGSSQAIAQEFLTRPSAWWVPGSELKDPSSHPIKEAVRLAASKLVHTLEKYGYEDPYAKRRNARPEEFKHYCSLDWSEEMESLSDGYIPLALKGRQAQALVDKLKREKDEREAKERWDNA